MEFISKGSVITGTDSSYKIQKELGRGAFGVTYLACRQDDNLEVALKTLEISKLSNWKSYDLFEREATVLKNLTHSNIPKYIDNFPVGDPKSPEGLAIAQEYIEGKNLRTMMQDGVLMNEGRIIGWFAQILEVLDYLHHLFPPVIHRDITPKNIMLSNDKAYLIDFGSVQAAVSTSIFPETTAGTFGFAPPEQFIQGALPASDLYGLAMTCLCFASRLEPGEMPFKDMKVKVKKIVQFDARFNLLLEEMTEPDAKNRLSDAKDALEKIKPLRLKYIDPENKNQSVLEEPAQN